jgi:hypothetical protein
MKREARKAAIGAYKEHSVAAGIYAVVERLDEEDVAGARERRLKDRQAHWAGEPVAAVIRAAI